MLVCVHCLMAIKSREPVFSRPFFKGGICEWCDEETDDLYEIKFEED